MNIWKRDLEKEVWKADFWYSWRKMEAAAQDRAGWNQMVCDPLEVTRPKSSQRLDGR